MGKVGAASWPSSKKPSAQQGTESSRMGGSRGETSIAIAPCSPIYEARPLQRYKYRNGDYMCYKIKLQETPVSFLYGSLQHP